MGNAASPARRSAFVLRFPGLKTVAIVVVGAAIWALLNVGSLRRFFVNLQYRNTQRDNVEAVREQVRQLEAQKQSLELGLFENEKTVRESYKLVHPGERLIVLHTDRKTSAAAGAGIAPKQKGVDTRRRD